MPTSLPYNKDKLPTGCRMPRKLSLYELWSCEMQYANASIPSICKHVFRSAVDAGTLSPRVDALRSLLPGSDPMNHLFGWRSERLLPLSHEISRRFLDVTRGQTIQRPPSELLKLRWRKR